MKKFFILLLSVTAVLLAQAGNVSPEEAKAKAEAFLKARHTTGKRHMMKLVKKANLQSTDVTAAYYVFNAEDNEGFVVVSGDNRTPAILGYADNGTFNTNDIPANMQAWLDEYARQLDYLNTHPKMRIAKAPAEDHAAIRPMVTTQWNQRSPYNLLCPMDDDELSVTGCLATAMAQVLYYHKYPARTIDGIPAYTTEEKRIFVDSIPPTDIDWGNMCDRYLGNETQQQQLAVAKLMQLCGSSIEMDYTSHSSSAYFDMIDIALKRYFDYDAATTYDYRANYTAKEWDKKMYNEIANNRPVFYGGQSTGGGHAFIIDGYDCDGLYHVNWGWGGNSDGYFLLSILDPDDNSGTGASSSTDGYSYDQGALFDAQPNTGVVPEIPKRMSTDDIWLDETTFYKSPTDSFRIAFNYSMYNWTGASCAFNLGYGVYNTDNEMVYHEGWDECYELGPNYGWNSISDWLDIPALPDGYYIVVPISRECGTTTWYQNDRSNEYFLTAHIQGDSLVLTAPTVDLSCEMTTTEKKEVGSKITVRTTIANNGTLFNKILFLNVNDEKKGGRHFDIESGETSTLEMDFTPEEAGSYTLSLGYYEWRWDSNEGWVEDYHELAATTIVVEPAKYYSLAFNNGFIANAEEKTINADYADIELNVSNTGTNNYDDDLKTWVWKINENTGGFAYFKQVDTPVSIPAGGSKPVRIHIGDLTDGIYWFIVVYKSYGEFTSYNDQLVCYRDLYRYTVVVPTAIETPKVDVTNQTDVIYDLQGRRVDSSRFTHHSSLKKGLYIVNGRLVIK